MKQSSSSKNEISKNNTLNYEYDKKNKKLNLGVIRVNLKSKMKNNNLPIKRNSTHREKKIQFFPNKNIQQSKSSKINPRSIHYTGSNYINNILRNNQENNYRKIFEDKQRLNKEKLKRVKYLLIECKKYFHNNKFIKEASSFRSNKTHQVEKGYISLAKSAPKKPCLKKKTSPLENNSYHINILRQENKSENIENDIKSPKEKKVKLNISNINNINNKYKTNEDIINDLKDICDEETNFSFCSNNNYNDNYNYQINQLSIERSSNFEICSSYHNLNQITKGKYIKDINFQKKIKLILKKYYLHKHKDTQLNEDSLSLRTLAFSSGIESSFYLTEYEKIKNKLEHKRQKQKSMKEKSLDNKKDEKEKSNTFYGTHKLNKLMKKKKILEKEINTTHIKQGKSLISKKLSPEQENKNNFEFFSTFKIPNQNEQKKQSIDVIGTDSLKVNKSLESSVYKMASKKKIKNKKNNESIGVDIKKDVNVYNNAEVEFVIDKMNKNEMIDDNIFLGNHSNKHINYTIYKNRKKNKRHHDYNKTIDERNKQLINQVLGIKIPHPNIVTNNIITTSSNIKENKEGEKIKNIETSFSIYNIVQKNINKNLNIIDNKENSSPRNYSRGFCLIT